MTNTIPYTQQHPSQNITICTTKYLTHFAGKEPNYDYISPMMFGESWWKLICGEVFSYKDMMLRVEAVYEGHRGYALSNVHGDKIKWYERMKLEEMFELNGIKRKGTK